MEAPAGYVKGCLASERFALGDVDHGIEVYDIGRRAVRLIPLYYSK